MITTDEMQIIISDYLDDCFLANRTPTKHSFSKYIHVAPATIRNVCNGFYATGKPYTNKPNARRIIDNADFDLIRNLFEKEDTPNEQ